MPPTSPCFYHPPSARSHERPRGESPNPRWTPPVPWSGRGIVSTVGVVVSSLIFCGSLSARVGSRTWYQRPDSLGMTDGGGCFHRQCDALRDRRSPAPPVAAQPSYGWTQNGLVLLIVFSAEADDLTLAQLLPTIATTSNQ